MMSLIDGIVSIEILIGNFKLSNCIVGSVRFIVGYEFFSATIRF